MGRRLNLQHLSETECEQVLQVIQRDFELRQKEQERLSKLETEVKDEDKKAELLSKQKDFNENCCMRCFSRFVFIFNQKVQCNHCKYYVCKSCAEYDNKFKEYVCNVCRKQGEYKAQSAEWFYDNIKNKFKRFGSAKVVRSLYKRRTDSDSEAEAPSRNERIGYRSEPSAKKKQRQPLQGLFEMDLDNPDGKDEPRAVVEDIIVAKEGRSSRNFNTPYTCSIATGQETFDEYCETEIKTFKEQLQSVVQDIHLTLDNQEPQRVMSSDQELQMLTEQKNNLVSVLSNLSQSLHIAVDNQNPAGSPRSPVAKHQLVQDVLLAQVQQFVSRPVKPKSGHHDNSPEALEEELSEIILKKIVSDYHDTSTARAIQEEKDVIHAFTKLSNKATLEQFDRRGYMSGSETDATDATQVEAPSDVDGRFSDYSLTTADISGDQVLGLTSGGQKDHDSKCSDNFASSSRDSDSGIVTSPTGRSLKTEQSLASDDSDYQVSSPREVCVVENTLPPKTERFTSMQTLSLSTPNLTNLGVHNDGEQKLGSNGSVVMDNSSEGYRSQGNMRDRQSGSSQIVNGGATDDQWEVVARTKTPSSVIPVVPDDDLDDLVKSNLINEEWNIVESRKSVVTSREEERDGSQYSITSDASTINLNLTLNDGTALSDQEVLSTQGQRVRSPRNRTSSAADSDVTLEGDACSTADASLLSDTERDLPEANGTNAQSVNHKGAGFEEEEESGDEHHVPLPSFLGSDRLDFEHGDLDDISMHHHHDEDDNMSTFSTEISFGRSWNFSGNDNFFHDRSRISAYDNFGDKKVGLDVDGPVIMLVPNKGGETGIKVGDKDVDELSDLSENPEDSDLSEGGDPDEDEEELRAEMETVLRHSVSCDSSVQTEEPVSPPSENLSGAPDTKDVLALALGTSSDPEPQVEPSTPVAPSKGLDMTAKLLELTPISTEGQETDPKFQLRPTDVTVAEGELAKFMCQVSGSEPLDVYWYKTSGTDDLIALNEDERCDTHRDGDTFTMEMYNPLKGDQGQILCIGINNEGRCTQGIRFFITENNSQKKVPEFIKPLQDSEVKVGSRVKLRVKVGGYPVPRVIWYKDGKRLTNSEHIKIEKYGNRDHALCIDYVTLDQDAEYSVVAKNLSGEAQSSAQLVVEDDSEGEDQYTRRSAPPSVTIEDYNGLYPDTEDLLKLAEQVSETRGQVTNTASKMLRSAGQMSTLHHQLDAMDQKLDDLEENAKVTDQVAMETEAYKEIYRDQILKEHDELQTSASAVRHITSTALDILTSADDIVQASNHTGDSQGIKRKSELISPASSNENEIEEVELKVSYVDFDKLFNAGVINRDQLRSGKVPRPVYDQVQEFLAQEQSLESFDDSSHDLTMDDLPTSIDCGLKRVDSKRYKRDYVINRDSPQVRRKKWEVPLSPHSSVDLVRSTPAGLREDPHEQISEAQEQIYLAAGRVSHLQEKISQLEDKVNEAEDDETTLAALEEEVARTAAQVKGNQKQVGEVEMEIQNVSAKKLPTQEKPEEQWRNILSPTQKRQSARFDFESQPKTSPADSDWRRSYGDKPVSSQIQIQLKSSATESKPPKLPTTPPPSKDLAPKLPTTPPPSKVSTAPPAERPPAVLLHGASAEDSLPESRTEYDEDISLPSVKNLRSMFNQSVPAPPETKRGGNVKRVYSLTGRDLPRNVREKLKAQSPGMAPNVNIRRSDDVSPDSPRRQPLDAVFERPTSPASPQSSTPIKDSLGDGTESTNSDNQVTRSSMSLNLTGPEVISTQKSSVTVSLGSESVKTPPIQKQPSVSHQSRSPTRQLVRQASSTTPRTTPTGGATAVTRLSSTHTAPRHSSTSTSPRTPTTPTTPTSPLKAPLRQKNSTIMARAAFWDSRITEGKASDKETPVEEFPEMPVENFKR